MSGAAPLHAGAHAGLHLVAAPRPGVNAQALLRACSIHPRLRAGQMVLHPVTRSGLPGAARRAADAAAAEGGIVLACGGDGTINAVAQAAWPRAVPMAVLPHGTFNYFSREHGLGDDVGLAFDQLLRLLPQQHCKAVPVGLVNDELFVVNASLGLYPRLLAERERASRRLGRHRWVAMAAGLASLLRHGSGPPLRLRLRDGEGRWTERTLALATLFAGNNRLQLGQLGLAPDDERLTALLLPPRDGLGLLDLAWQALRGRLGTAADVRTLPFTALELHPAEGRGRGLPLPTPRRKPPGLRVALDGETRWLPLPLRIRRAPRPLWLVAPPEQPSTVSAATSPSTRMPSAGRLPAEDHGAAPGPVLPQAQ